VEDLPVTRALKQSVGFALALVVAGVLGAAPAGAASVGRGATTSSEAGTIAPPAPGSELDGTAQPPSAETLRRVKAAQSGERTRSTAPGDAEVPLPTYAKADRPLTSVPANQRAYALTAPVPLGGGVRDGKGVAMFSLDNQLYDHPVVQATDGLNAIESYRITGTKAYLQQALADANRLIDTRVESRGAWFYPYPFDFRLHGNKTETIRAPWYSAMAQGQVLSLFVRLAEATADQSWRVAAENTVTSFTLAPVESDPTVPFVTWVDQDNHLWLEEYAQLPLTNTDRTINGQLFAMYGLWDAARYLHDERASTAFSGGAATIRSHILTSVRTPGWISRYCLQHVVLSDRYHLTVTGQLTTMFRYTGVSDWARYSDTFRDDYPTPTVRGTVDLAKGKVTGYRFDASGKLLASKSVTLSRQSSAPAGSRQRIRGRGIHYQVTAGSLAGYWVPERYPIARLRGLYAGTDYHLTRTATFPAGTASGYRVAEPSGATSSPLTVTLSRPSSAPFDRSWVVGGRPYVRITAGSFAGRWVPVAGLTLR
jgi:hypothetical protein